MTDTNHRRGFDGNTDQRVEYVMVEVKQACPDGTTVYAVGMGGDWCCGNHGRARARAGAKKYVHSRRRRNTRDWIKTEAWDAEA